MCQKLNIFNFSPLKSSNPDVRNDPFYTRVIVGTGTLLFCDFQKENVLRIFSEGLRDFKKKNENI